MNRLLLSKPEHSSFINGESSSNDENIVDITISGDALSTNDLEGVQSCERVWNWVELVMTLVQIVAAITVLAQAKGKHQETTWIIGYTCGCIATLPILYWRFWHYQNVTSEIRINEVVDLLEMMLEYFFVGWFVLFIWVFFIGKSSSLDHTTQLFWLCMVFLAFGCIRYVLPNLKCSAMCLCSPVTLSINAVYKVIKLIVTLIRRHLAPII